MSTTDPKELLRIKEEMLGLWARLPSEHQASVLLVLLSQSDGGDWAAQAHLFKKAQSGKPLKRPPW